VAEYEVTEKAGDYVLLTLRGELAEEFRVARVHEDLEEHYVDDGVKRIRVTLAEVPRISLEGVAALLDLWREARRRGKSFQVERASGQVRQKLETTGVLELIAADD
jgi:anti-anti-sigma regulatory factor